ncbi:hypothetical protein JKY72_06080 [Candidatus Gracilibacteria bacterium]|nr:hypothetical protein [Candidatus Gracilibacteria bacterium]
MESPSAPDQSYSFFRGLELAGSSAVEDRQSAVEVLLNANGRRLELWKALDERGVLIKKHQMLIYRFFLSALAYMIPVDKTVELDEGQLFTTAITKVRDAAMARGRGFTDIVKMAEHNALMRFICNEISICMSLFKVALHDALIDRSLEQIVVFVEDSLDGAMKSGHKKDWLE